MTTLSSAANALRAFEFLVERQEAGVSEIGRHLGVTPGTAHRLVSTLVAEGFAEQNGDNRRYRAGPKLLGLAARVRSRYDVRDLAHGHLSRLADSVRETANLGALQDNRIVYLDKVLSDQPFGIEAKVGARLPAYCTALGRAILAHSSDTMLERYLKAMEAGEAGDAAHPAPSREVLLKELAKVRRLGFAEDAGDYLPDVFCVAAPIIDAQDEVIAALSVSVPRSRFRKSRKPLAVAVRGAVDELSEELKSLGIAAPIA